MQVNEVERGKIVADAGLISTIEAIELESRRMIEEAQIEAKSIIENTRKIIAENASKLNIDMQEERQEQRKNAKLRQDRLVSEAVEKFKSDTGKELGKWSQRIPEAVDFLVERSLKFRGNR